MYYDFIVMIIIELSSMVSVIYFNSVFQKKYSNVRLSIVAFLLYLIISILFLFKVHSFNLLLFIIINFIFVKLCYKCNIKTAVFNVFILNALMMLSEFITLIIFKYKENITSENIISGLNFIIFAIISKTVYLLIVIIAKVTVIKKYSQQKNSFLYDNTYIFLLTIPFSTIFILSGLYVVLDNIKSDKSIVLLICILPLVISEFICYWFYDYIIEKNKKIEQLKGDVLRINVQYKEYELLKEKYESSRIMIHDIRKHLNVIKSMDRSSDDINNYINNVLSIDGVEKFCNNKALNIILNEKKKECNRYNIYFDININTNKINILQDVDIVTIFYNVIDNAIKCSKSEINKCIELNIINKNKNYLVIQVINSCTKKINFFKGLPLTNQNKDEHGWGLRSVKKTVDKYGGSLDFRVENEKFKLCIVMRCEDVYKTY